MKQIFVAPETNILPAFYAAMEEARLQDGPCEIIFYPGLYELRPEEAIRESLYVSNTMGINEQEDVTKTFALLIDDAKDLSINGNGAHFVAKGKVSSIALLNSENISLRNFSLDYENPGVTEMTVVRIDGETMDCRVHSDSKYRIENGKLYWYGSNFSFGSGISQLFDPVSGRSWREDGPMEDENLQTEELAPGLLRLHFKAGKDGQNPYHAEVGQVFQMRDPLRDELGIIVSDCKNVLLEDIEMNYMHGLGLIAQNSRDITIDGMVCEPTRGRTCAAFADFLHFSGCSGLITIENSRFVGAHDDAINVHGTHLLITKQKGHTITARYMHPQSYGFASHAIGETVEAIDPQTLRPVGRAEILGVKAVSLFEYELELSDVQGFSTGMAIENVDRTAEVIVRNNHFERIPTRGILVTTRRKVVIEDNVFKHLRMAAVLVSDDARGWYESGYVRDLTIQNNLFIDCEGPQILLKPEVEHDNAELPVHENISILNNHVEDSGAPFVDARLISNLTIQGNSTSALEPLEVQTVLCTDVTTEL